MLTFAQTHPTPPEQIATIMIMQILLLLGRPPVATWLSWTEVASWHCWQSCCIMSPRTFLSFVPWGLDVVIRWAPTDSTMAGTAWQTAPFLRVVTLHKTNSFLLKNSDSGFYFCHLEFYAAMLLLLAMLLLPTTSNTPLELWWQQQQCHKN